MYLIEFMKLSEKELAKIKDKDIELLFTESEFKEFTENEEIQKKIYNNLHKIYLLEGEQLYFKEYKQGFYTKYTKDKFNKKVEVRIYFKDLDMVIFNTMSLDKTILILKKQKNKIEKELKNRVFVNKKDKELMLVCKIYEYIFKNIVYDKMYFEYPSYIPFSYYTQKEKNYNRNTQNLEGVLINKTVCSGFASIFTVLAQMLGLKAYTVSGIYKLGEEKISHAWNVVYIDNEKYVLDISYDLETNKRKQKLLNKNYPAKFLVSKAKFKEYIEYETGSYRNIEEIKDGKIPSYKKLMTNIKSVKEAEIQKIFKQEQILKLNSKEKEKIEKVEEKIQKEIDKSPKTRFDNQFIHIDIRKEKDLEKVEKKKLKEEKKIIIYLKSFELLKYINKKLIYNKNKLAIKYIYLEIDEQKQINKIDEIGIKNLKQEFKEFLQIQKLIEDNNLKFDYLILKIKGYPYIKTLNDI